MARQSEEERDVLKRAAEGAAPILAKLRQQRAALDARIARLELVIAASQEASGRRRRSSDGETPAVMAKMPRGQVRMHIDSVLAGGSDHTLPDLRKEIFASFGISYNRPTLYSALRRGARDGRYEIKEGSRWRLKS